MSGKNHHSEPFDDSTLVKLDLYRRYVRAWIPVFLNAPNLVVDKIQIFDFFAGPGRDLNGVSGSPVIALEEIRLALAKDHRNHLEIHLYLNEYMKSKYEILRQVCEEPEFKGLVRFHFENLDFAEVIERWGPEFSREFNDPVITANLLFLDQNGTKQITQPVFRKIVTADRTDFLFFIASSYINRFKMQPQNRAGTPIEDSDLVGMTTKNAHRRVCNAYKRWLPCECEYYLAPFSIAKDKGSNVYGLIFGSGHPAGIDKFLRICWEEDTLRGEANYDIDGEHLNINQPMLWESMEVPNKLQVFERDLREQVLSRQLCTNVAVYKFALLEGCRASHAKDVLEKMVKEKLLPKQRFSISYEACGFRGSVPKAILYPDGGGR